MSENIQLYVKEVASEDNIRNDCANGVAGSDVDCTILRGESNDKIVQELLKFAKIAETKMYADIGSMIFNIGVAGINIGSLVMDLMVEKDLKQVASDLKDNKISVEDALKKLKKHKDTLNLLKNLGFVGAATGIANNIWGGLSAGIMDESFMELINK